MLHGEKSYDEPGSMPATGQDTETLANRLPPLQDRFGRTFDYVRIAITEKCNLRCTYCMPEEGVDLKSKESILSAEEINRTITVLARMGIKKVRFTGGEPLVRKDIVDLVAGAAAAPGIKTVHLTTNGLLFDRYAADLRKAGLFGVNISLDTMEPDRFQTITRRTGGDTVMKAIELAVELGFPRVKINVVMMKGFNDDELFRFTELTKDLPVTVRFIEFMPFDAHQIWESGVHFASAENMVNQIEDYYPGIREAAGTRTEHHTFQATGYKGKIAVIPAFTRSLCGNCSRIRVTADGQIRNCLYSDMEYSLRDVMRNGGSDDDIVATFRKAFAEKARDGFEAKKQSTAARKVKLTDIGRVSMTQIGG